MFHMNQNLKVVLAVAPVDLRKSFSGLYAMTRSELGEVPEDGALFIWFYVNFYGESSVRV